MLAARPVLLEHGQAATTRQIAEAAGVAEGTLFRSFATKDALVDAVLAREFDPETFLAAIAAIDLDLPLRDRLVAAVSVLQGRFVGIFALMTALGMPRPPARLSPEEVRRRLADHGLAALLEPDVGRLRVPVDEVAHVLRLLTFSGSHPHISQQRPMSPEAIVEVVLYGVLGPGAPDTPASDTPETRGTAESAETAETETPEVDRCC